MPAVAKAPEPLAAAPELPDVPTASPLAPELADESALADELAPPAPPVLLGRAWVVDRAWPVRPWLVVPLVPSAPVLPWWASGLAMAVEVALPVFPELDACDDTFTFPVLPLWATGEIFDTDPESAVEPLAAAATP